MRRFQLGNEILDSGAHAGGMLGCRPSCSQKVQLSCSRLRVVASSLFFHNALQLC